MKLKCGFEAVDMGDEIIFVPVGQGAEQVHGVLKLNREGQEIANLLRNDTTEEQIVDILSSKYDNDRVTLIDYVANFVQTLKDAGLIDEQ